MYILRRVCSYCNKQYGTKPCIEKNHNQVTHGICQGCAVKVYVDMGFSEEEAKAEVTTIFSNDTPKENTLPV